MATYQRTFDVANPSPYERSDYVQIDLNKLKVPPSLDEDALTLYRLNNDDRQQEIPFQIDYPFGRENGSRIITFLSSKTPPGRENYTEKTATFQLLEEKPTQADTPSDLEVRHFYEAPQLEEAEDGVMEWDPDRRVKGVKLFNSTLKIYFKLIPVLPPTGLSYVGSATSVEMPLVKLFTGEAEMLSPYWEDPEKLWGQVYKLVFYPLPWEHKWFHRFDLRNQEYELVWSKNGPVRAIVSLKSAPLTIPYDGSPFFGDTKVVEVKAHLYRVIYVYSGQRPYYTEELFVLTDREHKFLSFRPYYFSKISPAKVPPELKWFAHIPDYFALWKYFGLHHRGYGFATDVHVRWVRTKEDELHWSLPLNRNCRCIHYFMFQPSPQFDYFHEIGHSGWYERVFKPLRPYDFSLRFPPHLEYYE